MMIPVLVLPFMVILFYILGGGKTKASRLNTATQIGLNLQLPDAHFFKRKEPDKLGLYEASNKDSDDRRQALRNDPYRMDSMKTGNAVKGIFEKTAERFPVEDMVAKNFSGTNRPSADDKAKELMEKLGKLKEQLNRPTTGDEPDRTKLLRYPEMQEPIMADRLRSIQAEPKPDAEVSQWNTVLDKLVAIQHPEMIADSLARRSSEQKQTAYSVRLNNDSDEPGSFGDGSLADIVVSGGTNRFYGLDADQQTERENDNAIQAVIPETQTLVSGSTVKFRLASDIRINGHLISKGEFIYGICSMQGERLKIEFSSMRAGNSILPVSLQVYDLDGLPGIFIPGSINRDAVKQSGDQAINGLGLASLDPSIGAQAATAGIQTAKTLLSRRVKLIRVTVKAGYQVLLKDDRK